MNKSGKMKVAVRKNRMSAVLKRIVLFPWRVIKAIWRALVRACRAVWNWLIHKRHKL